MIEKSESEQLLHRLFGQVSEHIETRLAYFSLTSAEKISAIAANMAGAFSVFIFALLMLFFFSLGFSWWLGDLIGNRAGGFALAGLVFIPIAALVFQWVRPFVREKILQAALNESDDEPETLNNHG